jgi:hypothetical protein
MLQLLFTANIVPSPLMMEATLSSETSVVTNATRLRISEHDILLKRDLEEICSSET